MIKAVMFDMGGTLEDLYSEEKNDRATAYALYDILQKHHIQVPYEAEALWAIVNRSRSGATGASRTFPWTGKS